MHRRLHNLKWMLYKTGGANALGAGVCKFGRYTAMKQILVELDRDADNVLQMEEIRKAWDTGRYRSLLIHVYSGQDIDVLVTQVAKNIQRLFPKALIAGTMSAGEIKDGRMMRQGLLVAAILFETTDVRILRYDKVSGNEEAIGRRICADLNAIDEIQAAEMLFPGTEVDTRPLFEEVSKCDPHIKIFGGYSGGHMLNAPVHYIFDESGVMYDSIFVTAFAGADFHVDVDKLIGWEALGLPFTVTKAEGNRLIELDGRPAAEVYEGFLQIDRSQHNNAEEGYTFPLMTEYKGEKWLRSTIHIEEDGSLNLHGYVMEGTSIQLSFGNPLTIVGLVNERLQKVRAFHPEVIRLYSCIVRKAFWGSYVDMEMQPFENYGSTAGFHSWGEVIRNEDTGEVVEHNVTLLSVLMREGPIPEGEVLPEVQVDDSVLRGPGAQLRRLTSMVAATMGALQEAHNDLQLLNMRLVEMAERDALTHLYARGKTEEIIQGALTDSAETDCPVTLVMLDVDHFKQVNDRYGHHIGDLVLQGLAHHLVEAVKDCDGGAAGRWGGEEFFLVFPNTESAEGLKRAEALRKGVEADRFCEVGKVTISLGVITVQGVSDPLRIFSQVDDALYRAKKSGRNRTEQA